MLITGGNGAADNPDSDASQDNFGGGILVDAGASLTVSDSTLSGNSAQVAGGGIDNAGTLTVTDSTLSGNSAVGFVAGGGGICNVGTATVTDSSTLSGNSADGGEEGLYNFYNGTLSVIGCTLSGNSAFSATEGEFLISYGGGIANDGTLTVKGTTVSGNSTDAWGAGICNDGTATVSDGVIRGSSGPPGLAAVAYGGGIFNQGRLTVNACTLPDNSASFEGGAHLEQLNAEHQRYGVLCGNSAAYGSGILYDSRAELTVAGCLLSSNTATYGGAHLHRQRWHPPRSGVGDTSATAPSSATPPSMVVASTTMPARSPSAEACSTATRPARPRAASTTPPPTSTGTSILELSRSTSSASSPGIAQPRRVPAVDVDNLAVLNQQHGSIIGVLDGNPAIPI